MIQSMDHDLGRILLSTKQLEPTPGDMLRDPHLVSDKADETAAAMAKKKEDNRVSS